MFVPGLRSLCNDGLQENDASSKVLPPKRLYFEEDMNGR